MNPPIKPPVLMTPVSATFVALADFVACFASVAGSAPQATTLLLLLVETGLIALAVLQWVVYFRAYVDFRFEELASREVGGPQGRA